MAQPRNQHYVPQFYLRHFAMPESLHQKNRWIRALRLSDGYEASRPIKKVAALDYLYTPLQPDGTRCYRVDSKIGALENDVAPFWKLIADGTFNLEGKAGAKKLISLFIATLHLRNPKMKAMCIESHRGLAELADSITSHSGPSEPLIQIAQKIYPVDVESFRNIPSFDETELTKSFTGLIEDVAVELAEALLEKKWLLIVANSPVFLTSDSPVVMLHRQRDKFGFATKGTEFMFPISPTRLLHLHDHDDWPGNVCVRATPWMTAVQNIAIAGHGVEYVFSHGRIAPVLDAAMRMTDTFPK